MVPDTRVATASESASRRSGDGEERDSRARVERLERALDAVAAAAGVSWYPCPHCEPGVVVEADDEIRCTDCSYGRPA
ncbi:MAG: hypothetical protein ABEJ08_02760 [Halobacteriaceae archaeon]